VAGPSNVVTSRSGKPDACAVLPRCGALLVALSNHRLRSLGGFRPVEQEAQARDSEQEVTASSALSATSSVKVVNDGRETDATARLASTFLLAHHRHVHQSSPACRQAFIVLGHAHLRTIIATFKAASSTKGL
jgi:hypothetical protein